MDGSAHSLDVLPLVRRAQQFFETLQDSICFALEGIDRQGTFSRDPWTREEGGGGLTRVLESDGVFEKAAVNTSTVHGNLPERMAMRMNVDLSPFIASGISLVVHPKNPFVPIVHANLRYFELGSGDSWFGGGMDLTPIYLKEEVATHFHRILKDVCDRHNVEFYPRFKQWCDEYFTI